MTGRPHSLQGRLLAWVLGMVVVVWLSSSVTTWFDARHELEELLDGHLAQAAALLVVQQSGEVEDDRHDLDAPTLHRYAPKVAFQVFHEGRLAQRSANAPAAPMSAPGRPFRVGFDTVQIGGVSWRVFAAQGREQDVRVYVGEQMSSRMEILWAVLRSTLWPMVVALPLLALAVWGAVRLGVSPIRRLGQALAQREPQALHPVAVAGAPVEMLPMIEALNALFARIDHLRASERRFTADAAHELRTPIAAIRAQAQVALAEPDEQARRHALLNTVQGCDRATRLVDQLLTLSRLEAADATALQAVDLRAVTQGVLAELAPKALGKHQTLEFEAPQPCFMRGNETLLAVLVRNLVDNAVRYSPPSARVTVALRQEAGRVVLSVEDSGPGLAEADRGRLGERFFRMPGSPESGSGLGWSIVRRIAQVHRLDVQVEPSSQLGGLAVCVTGAALRPL